MDHHSRRELRDRRLASPHRTPYHRAPGSGSLRRAASALALALTVALIGAGSAQAALFDDQYGLRDTMSSSIRGTFVVDPNAGQWLSRAQLLARATFYDGRGFDRDFLTWAPERTITVDGATRWARCGVAASSAVLCPDGTPLDFNEVRDVVGDGVLRVFGDTAAFVSLVCGNHSESGADVAPPTISGVKYEDLDGDGARDTGEPGLRGWTIRLRYEGGVVTTATTDALGRYSFTLTADQFPQLSGGTYSVEEVLQDGWVQSDRPDPVQVSVGDAGREITGMDFGNYRPATIEGTKFDDHDVDGVRDAGEPGLEGWTIARSGGASDVTDPDGAYRFTGLRPGTYTVAEVLRSGWRQTAPRPPGSHEITVRSGDTTSADFGNVCLGTTDVRITDVSSGLPLAGVEVRIEEITVSGILDNEPPLPRTTTAAPMFGELLPGSYRVIAFLPDGVFTTDPDLHVVDGRLAVVKQVTVRECATITVPVAMVTKSNGKVTGGMRMDVPGGYATAGFVFMTRQGRPEGSLEYIDHATGLNLHTDAIKLVYVQGRKAVIGGDVLVGGVWHDFQLTLIDNGEPGTEDRFELVVTTGYIVGRDQTIEGGNDQIHPPERA